MTKKGDCNVIQMPDSDFGAQIFGLKCMDSVFSGDQFLWVNIRWYDQNVVPCVFRHSDLSMVEINIFWFGYHGGSPVGGS